MCNGYKEMENTTHCLTFNQRKMCFYPCLMQKIRSDPWGRTNKSGVYIYLFCLWIILPINWSIWYHSSSTTETPLHCNKCRDIHTAMLSTICKTQHRRHLNACQNPVNGLSKDCSEFDLHKHTQKHVCSSSPGLTARGTEDLAHLDPEGTWFRNVHW